jgi:hypothetical protein
MVTLKRVSAKSAGLIGFWFGTALIIMQITFFIVLFTFQSSGIPNFVFQFSFWIAMLRLTLTVALQTAIFFGASAYIYNLISKWHGGLKLEFEPMPTAGRKRKNDEIVDNNDDDDKGPGDYKKRIEID